MCIVAGQLLLEISERCQHGQFMQIVESCIPEIPHRTATSWMAAAKTVNRLLNLSSAVDIDAEVTRLSDVLLADPKSLSSEARELHQLWFNFTQGKTIKEITNGDEVTGLARGLAGKVKGGGSDVDRKDFGKFISKHLDIITSLLLGSKYKGRTVTNQAPRKFSDAELCAIHGAFCNALELWPADLLRLLADKCKAELKLPPLERAQRNLKR